MSWGASLSEKPLLGSLRPLLPGGQTRVPCKQSTGSRVRSLPCWGAQEAVPLSQDQPPVWFRGAPSPSPSWLWSCDNLGFQPCPGGLPSPAHSSANRPRSLCLTGACFLLGPSGHTGPDGSSEGGEGPAGVGRGAGVKGGTGTPVGRQGRRRDDRARGAGAPLGRPLPTATWEARARLTRSGDVPGGPLGHAGHTCETRGATCVPQEEDRGRGLCGRGDGSRELQPNVHEDRPPRVGGGHIPRGAVVQTSRAPRPRRPPPWTPRLRLRSGDAGSRLGRALPPGLYVLRSFVRETRLWHRWRGAGSCQPWARRVGARRARSRGLQVFSNQKQFLEAL